jgi:hypothetical protein
MTLEDLLLALVVATAYMVGVVTGIALEVRP